MDRKDAGHTAEPGGEELGLGGQGSRVPMTCPCRVPGPGSPFRDEITLAILQLQENNRLEILKRKWWEGGRCPKEEDHRAKGKGGRGPPPAWETRAACLWLPNPRSL